jgi:hypothetical protein
MEFNLSEYEKTMFYSLLYGDLNVFGVSVISSAEIEYNLSRETVEQALFYLKKRHPLLRAHIRHDIDSEDVHFVINELKNSPRVELEWSKVDSRDEMVLEIEKFSSKKFKYGPGILTWESKVIEINNQHNNSKPWAICILLPLFVTDGINISTLLVELVNIINSVGTGKECNEMKLDLNLIGSLNDETIKSGFFIEKHEKLLEELKKKRYNSFLLHDEFKKFNESGLKINLMRFDLQTTQLIVKKCKEKNLKMTGFLNSALIYALNSLYNENNLEFPKHFACDIPANFRLRLNPMLDFSHVRDLVFLAKVNFDTPNFGQFRDIWKDAEYINKFIDAGLCTEDGSIFLASHDIDFLMKLNKIWQNSLLNESNCDLSSIKGHYSDLVLSNTGRWVYDYKKRVDGPLSINEIYYGDSLTSNPNLSCAVIFHSSYWNKELQVCFSSNKSSIGSIFMDRFAALFEKIVIDSVQNS